MKSSRDIIEVSYRDQIVGRLAEWKGGTIWEYDSGFLKTGIELSPFALPLKPEPQFKNNKFFHFLPGVISDALPDAWGTRVMDRFFKSHATLTGTPLQRLAYVGDNGMGALSFRPSLQGHQTDGEVSLTDLQLAAQHILKDDAPEAKWIDFLRVGSSAGGARPKAVVSLDPESGKLWPGRGPKPGLEHWLIKFQSDPEDPETRIEHALSKLAARCGIRVPETKLFESKNANGETVFHFGSRRFDVVNDQRIQLLSFAGLMENDFEGSLEPDYSVLLRAGGRLTGNYQEKVELFRRAVFNVLVSNGDDHTKNHAFLFDGSNWKTSPAYDITYSDLASNSARAMPVMGKVHHVTAADLDRLGSKADITAKDRETVMDQVISGTALWPVVAEAAGVHSKMIEVVRDAIRDRKKELEQKTAFLAGPEKIRGSFSR